MTETIGEPLASPQNGSQGQGGPLEYRSSEVVGVSFPDRVIELVVMPYEKAATVVHHGRVITEICSRGAYNGIQRRADKVKANRDHNLERLVGKAAAFHPSRQEGLVAELKISRTALGDETLELAGDGVLDASAGFALLADERGRVYPDAEVWENRSRRRLNRLHLGHIALVPEPAYETANVLAVRQRDDVKGDAPSTPNLDRLEIERLRAEYARLDERYSL
jgi:HK97 family phage prohead protease